MSKWVKSTVSLCFLSTFVACNDVSSNRKQGQPDVSNPGIEADNSIRSSIHRRSGSAVLSYQEEISNTLSGNLPNAYAPVPDMTLDDEGTNDGNIHTQTSLGRPTSVCGASDAFPNVSARISDCESKNGTSAKWQGSSNGAAGEGNWKLVSLSQTGREIWQDERTGMVWSDIMSTEGKSTFNWCKASGNQQGPTSAAVVDCQTLSEGQSICHGFEMEGIGDQIRWRLPTRNDYLQADLNGLRFVLRLINNEILWTATMKARIQGRTEAWLYSPISGTLSSDLLTYETHVRCIGVPSL